MFVFFNRLVLFISSSLSFILIGVIRIYQLIISPLFPPSCRFQPTCSHYAIVAFRRFGFFRGMFLTVKRVLKCHPWNEGGNDPVPNCSKREESK